MTVNVLVVSPHRDDAAFSFGLTIKGWLAAGHRVTVLNCFTRSEWAPYSDARTLHANDRASFVTALRRREDLAWNKQLGGELHFHDLDLFDAPLRLMCAVEEVFTQELRPGDRALARVTGAVAKLGKTMAAVVAPLALGNHIDHRIARHAATGALAGSDCPALAFYEDLPYAAETDIAATFGFSGAACTADLQPAFAIPLAADVAEAVRAKARMAECYDSQVDSPVVRAIAEHAAGYGGRERLWVSPAWWSTPFAQESPA